MANMKLTANNPPPPVACFLRALGVDAEMDILHVWGRGRSAKVKDGINRFE